MHTSPLASTGSPTARLACFREYPAALALYPAVRCRLPFGMPISANLAARTWYPFQTKT